MRATIAFSLLLCACEQVAVNVTTDLAGAGSSDLAGIEPADLTRGEPPDLTAMVEGPDLGESQDLAAAVFDLAMPPDLAKAPALLTLSASTPFGSIATSAASSPRGFTVTNAGQLDSGTLSVTVEGANSAEFMITDDQCSAKVVAGGDTCTVSIVFSPSALGARTATLKVLAAPGGEATVGLEGTGVTPATLSIDPTGPFSFGNVATGLASDQSSFTITNTGGATSGTLTITLEGADAARFTFVDKPCDGVALGGGDPCTVILTFNPNAPGARSATLHVVASPGGTLDVELSGSGVTPATLTMTAPAVPAIDFGGVVNGTSSATVDVVVKNTGGVPTGALGVSLTGANAARFELVQSCTIALAPGASCTIKVRLNPNALGPFAASLEVSASPGGALPPVALGGTGIEPAMLLISGTLTFGGVPRGSSSGEQTFTVENTGDAPTGAPVAAGLTGGDSTDFAITFNNCSSALAAGGSCTVKVTFSPAGGTTLGDKSTTLRATAPGLQFDASLSGTAVTPSALLVSPADAFTFTPAVIADGSNFLDQVFTITNQGGTATGPIALGISDGTHYQILAGSSCAGNSLDANEGESCTLTVRFLPLLDASGSLGTTLSLTENGKITTKSLSGTAQAPAKLAWSDPPSPFDFGAVRVSTSSEYQTFTLSNTGDSPSSAVTLGTAGSNANQFELANDNCSTQTVAAHGSCTVQRRFSPTSGGAKSMTMTASATSGGSANVDLTGTGRWRLVVSPTITALGTNSVTSGIAGINCGIDCNEEYVDGQVVVLTASPDVSSQNVVWGGCDSTTTTTCTVTLNSTGAVSGTKTVTAAFNIKSFTLTVDKTDSVGGATGTVTSDLAGINCNAANADCSQSYTYGQSVVLTEAPTASYGFRRWGGACSGTATTCTVAMTQDRTVSAAFTPFNKVFVTSGTWRGNLGGTTGADGLCNTAASGKVSGNFKAWVAGPDTITTRIGTARGWVRLDGAPVLDSIAATFASKQFYHPINIDENSANIGHLNGVDVWTGITDAGDTSNTCTNWTIDCTGACLTGRHGNAQAGGTTWTSSTTNGCGAFKRLYCFQTDYQAVLPSPPAPTGSTWGRAFLSTTYSIPAPGAGVNGTPGIADLDARCQADSAGSGLTFRALAATDGTSGYSRFSATSIANWYRVDNLRVFSKTDLQNGALPAAPLTQQWNGTYPAGASGTITGGGNSNVNGTNANTCDSWSTNGAGNIRYGQANLLQSRSGGTLYPAAWWDFGGANCDFSHRIYCLEYRP